MLIESTSPSHQISYQKIAKVICITCFSIAISTPIFLIILGKAATPTGTFANPLPPGEIASAHLAPSPTQNLRNFAATLNLSQNYLEKAYQLAKNSNQTDTDKNTIIATLNHSLETVNSAINLSPNDPAGYIMRARILTAISKIRPEAITKAKEDLLVAEKLSNGMPVDLPAPINPINLIPDQRASLAENIIIAAPISSNSATQSSVVDSNSTISSATLKASQTELIITDSRITADSYIYLLPKGKPSSPIFVKSKAEGVFIISTSTTNTSDLVVDYWLINP